MNRTLKVNNRRLRTVGFVGVAAVIAISCADPRSGSEGKSGQTASADSTGLPLECAPEAAALPGNPPQHPAACHGNPNFVTDGTAVMTRDDIANLPADLKNRITRLACRPHTFLPMQIFNEADTSSQLFQYYILDSTGEAGSGIGVGPAASNFEPNVFTSRFPGVNDFAQFTAFGANCGLSTIASVRLVVEPKPGLPTDPDNPRAFIDVFTDVSGLFVINNETGWYEGWMIHDLRVAQVDPNPLDCGRPHFGLITEDDAERLAAMGSGNNVPGNFFTVDGEAPHFPSADDHFPDRVTNVVPLQLSMGAYNALQQSDAHNYWEFNYNTNWIHPLYELPFTGGFPDHQATDPADTFQDGEIGRRASIVPGDRIGLNQDRARTVKFGDNPNLPRDADKFEAALADGTESPATVAQREFRERFIPSAVAREVFLNTFERLDSFRPDLTDLEQRLVEGYKEAIDFVERGVVNVGNRNGIIEAIEGEIDTCNDNCFPPTPSDTCTVSDSSCLYLSPRTYDRFAVTREINDGYLAPRFAPSQRAWVLSGNRVDVTPTISASAGRDSDDR